MAEKTATEASNDFFLKFRAERQAIQDLIERSQDIPKHDLANHFNDALQEINHLEQRLTKATAYIPSYDERQFSIQLKELNDALDKTKTDLTPKPKFSFKSKKKKTVTKLPSSTDVKTIQEQKDDTDMLSDATVLFKDKTNTILSLENQNTNGSRIDVLLSNLKDCIIILEKKDVSLSAIHIKNVDRCVIYGGTIEGSVLMYGLTNSTLIVGCHQFRMHESHNVDIMLHVTSRPIIEDSNQIQVGRWDVEGSNNYYDQVEDFNWLKKQASPNWKVMDSTREKTLESQLDLFKNHKEDLLTKQSELLPLS
ncbi:tubulin binding cofactor C-domain-containing protein [Choanephora cucurbitarum]|nr:tubulin binding cofactor C-domain-containing protein [Choanephora cucurbitarum]